MRPGQEEAIRSVTSGRDTLAVLPTGAGKSAIYQLAALVIPGPTVVVSPLIALQRDQVQALLANDVAAAEANSHVGAAAKRRAFAELASGDLEFLFLAPEQLANPDVLADTVAAEPSLLVVDEAHCISSWGHDFRPEYLRLGEFAAALGRPPILALTATASPPVRDEIVERLGLVDPAVVVRGFDRPNIALSVRRFTHPESKRAALLDEVVRRRGDGDGIVYVATRRAADEVAEALASRRVVAAAYHAGLAAGARREVEARFAADGLEVVVATTAFGMGIDKANVRYVLHHDVADSLDAYYQEIGRGGRDGAPAQAVLFYRPEDLGLRRFFASAPGPDPIDVAAVVAGAGREDGLSATRLASAQAFLAEIGDVDDAAEAAARAAEAREARQKVQRSRVEMMRAYAEARGCRRQVLLGYFGEPLESPCGNCDRCLAGDAGSDERDGCGDGGGEDDDVVRPFPVHAQVAHTAWGDGQVLGYEGSTMTVYFDSVGYKTLDVDLVRDGELLRERAG